ncbi:MAG TPA: 50S ribosomal protein L7/L12 [Candidatus Dependentiae bacterium]|nr:50S ribosomal protein L7/L12 [Candidatus Dependentiae bacterium]HRQ62249.1 50S ribosomal protein L7/L12 [Candidatus Dependentiae bacterium]
MASKIEKLVEEIGSLTMLESADLVKALEDKFGVSAAMPMVAGAPAVATEAAAPAAEKKEYKVTLKESGAEKIKTIKALREVVSGLSLSDAKKAVDETPSVIAEAAPKEDAEKIKKKLEEAGAKVELS